MNEKKVLVIREASAYSPTWNGGVGKHRRVVQPGKVFTGKEGRLGEQNTGWYEPVEWLTKEEADDRLRENLWDSETYDKGFLEELLAEPGDFPGLEENYPEVAAAFYEG